jgi:hypothetical protein
MSPGDGRLFYFDIVVALVSARHSDIFDGQTHNEFIT